MTQPDSLAAIWRAYCQTQPGPDRCLEQPRDSWGFGDSPAMADELGQAVVRGDKTTTTGPLREDEHMAWRTPEVGDRIIILDGAGVPLCIIRSTAVETMRFDQVDDRFARLEGEGFRDRSDWRAAHWRYFSRRYQEIGREPTRDMPVVRHEFGVVHLVRTAGTRATPWDAGPR